MADDNSPQSKSPLSSFPRLEYSISREPLKQIEKRDMDRTSNYNETVRANNRRIDRGEPIKRLPSGDTARKEWRGRSGR